MLNYNHLNVKNMKIKLKFLKEENILYQNDFNNFPQETGKVTTINEQI